MTWWKKPGCSSIHELSYCGLSARSDWLFPLLQCSTAARWLCWGGESSFHFSSALTCCRYTTAWNHTGLQLAPLGTSRVCEARRDLHWFTDIGFSLVCFWTQSGWMLEINAFQVSLTTDSLAVDQECSLIKKGLLKFLSVVILHSHLIFNPCGSIFFHWGSSQRTLPQYD